MSAPLFPLVFANEEVRLLTGLVLGFLFGFSLERAGFGNARKLAAQFYFYDMTVFKVMFTAILVAMVGFYGMANLGWVDLSRMWINPTFMWAQAIGGFLLGIGFIMSGLCPGTSVVSAASGRWDGLVTFGGIFVGTLMFALLVAWIPGLEALYGAGSMGVSLLPELLSVPAPWFAAGVVIAALLAFVGAEKVERIFARKREPIELEPRPRPRLKFALSGALVAVVAVAVMAARPAAPSLLTPPGEIAPLEVAEAIVEGDPDLLVLDLRPETDTDDPVRGALRVSLAGEVPPALAAAKAGTRVVIYTREGGPAALPQAWPRAPRYLVLAGGLEGWTAEVLTPLEIDGPVSLARRQEVERQRAIAAFFSGAAPAAPSVAAPPPAIPTGGAKKKKAGGC